ncbi:hypothetical protein GCM10023322_36300 [Rugosimonospora acidiphila]|uniref:Transcription regulator PadR N-terminal domain-containing protein n=1 Tax=Rugosimonospora acidiphila TaxID=556531 RepID=A0ABP9RUT4_9ACTN
MWIDILLLSKLAGGPLHGYELRKAIEASTGRTLSNNSLYPTLRHFVDAGAVTRSAEQQEAKPPRHVYAITDVGRELLHDMLVDFPDDLAPHEPEFLARLGNLGWLDRAEQLRILDTRDRALAQKRERLAARASTQPDPWSRAALDHLCRGLDAERRRLAELRDDLPTPEALDAARPRLPRIDQERRPDPHLGPAALENQESGNHDEEEPHDRHRPGHATTSV